MDTRLKALQPGTTSGDLAYSSATANTNTRLAIGSTSQVLTVVAGVPAWATPVSAITYVGVSLYKSANQSLTDATDTIVSFNTEKFDTNTFHDNTTNNSRITIPASYGGKYLLTAMMYYQNNATGLRTLGIKKNGTDINFFYMSPNASYNTVQGSIVLSLIATDYIELLAYQNSGGALNLNGGADSTFFQMTYLGA